MKYKKLIFDFDGTLADTLAITVTIYNELAEKYHGRKITQKEVVELQKHPLKEIFTYLRIPVYRLPFYLYKGRILFKKYTKNLSPIEHIPNMLVKLRSHYTMGILSSNSTENIDLFLKNNNLDFFDFIYCEKNIFGKHTAIKHILKKNKLVPNEVLYIGDEVRDIESCHKAGIDVAAVGWGYNSIGILKIHHPTFLVETPRELRKLLL